MDNAITTSGDTTAELQPGWIDIFLGTLISPQETFRHLVEGSCDKFYGIGGAALAVALAFGLEGLRMVPADTAGLAWVTVPVSLMMGFAYWLCVSALIAILAGAFGARAARIRACVVTLGWSLLPWIFMAPLFCYQNLLGKSFALLTLLPFAWVFSLMVLAIKESFNLENWQLVSLLLIAPFLFQTLQFLQMVQAIYVAVSSLT